MTTIGDLTPNDIGNDPILCSPDRNLHVVHVGTTLALGSITLGPLDRDHPCEVIA